VETYYSAPVTTHYEPPKPKYNKYDLPKYDTKPTYNKYDLPKYDTKPTYNKYDLPKYETRLPTYEPAPAYKPAPTYEPVKLPDEEITCADGSVFTCEAGKCPDFYNNSPSYCYLTEIEHPPHPSPTIPTHAPRAGKGEICEGFNEAAHEPYPFCEEGLLCGLRQGVRAMPGATNVCFDPIMMDADGVMPAEIYDHIKYPALAQDFFANGEVVVKTPPSYEHIYATPEECEPCNEKNLRIQELQKEIADFK